MRNLIVREVECKTILNRSTLPWTDYTLNAYQGCAFGCSYCYVPFMRAKYGIPQDRLWGTWVDVKTNAPDVLRRQMLNVSPAHRIDIGTASDSWQPLEKKYEISRQILRELSYYPNPVHLLTRSPLLIRDIDILCQIPNVRVGVSLPTFDDAIREAFEPDAPTVAGRIALIKRLLEAKVFVRLFWCPILTGVCDSRTAVRTYIQSAADIGIRDMMYGALNHGESLAAGNLVRLVKLRAESPQSLTEPALTRQELKLEIELCARRCGIRC